MLRTIVALSALALLVPASAARAQSCGTPAAGADTIHLRKDCTGYTDCIDDSPGCGLAEVMDWLWTGASPRNPSVADPVAVDIGPGRFDGIIACSPGEGHVSFRGDGREATRVVATGITAVWMNACDDVGFQDLELDGGTYGTALLNQNGGTSTFTDVDLEGSTAIYDYTCGGAGTDPPVGDHRLTGVEITATSVGLIAECSRFRLASSAVRVVPSSGAATQAGIGVAHRGDVEMLGGSIRVDASSLTSGSGLFVGALVGVPSQAVATGYGTFRMHAGLITVDVSGIAGKEAYGLAVDAGSGGDAKGVAAGTGFELRVASGATAHRLAGTGEIEAPQLRPAGLDPEPGLASLPGADLFVENGCEIGGDCDADLCDDQGDPLCAPRLMIHWPACGSSPWWDAASGGCRQ